VPPHRVNRSFGWQVLDASTQLDRVDVAPHREALVEVFEPTAIEKPTDPPRLADDPVLPHAAESSISTLLTF
jgi:hypothetical protein